MTKLVVWLLFFGLYTLQTVGHMNSDPAPGRSPGPPSPTESITAFKRTNASTVPAHTQLPSKDETTGHNVGNQVALQVNNKPLDAASHLATTIVSNLSSEINFESEKLNQIKINVHENDATNEETGSGVNVEPDLLLERDGMQLNLNANVTRPSPQQNDKLQMRQTGPDMPCRKGLSGFLKDVVVVNEDDDDGDGKDEQPTTQTTDDIHGQQRLVPQLNIKLQLEHDIFDTTALGISCGLMYQVSLHTILPPTIPLASPSISASTTSSSSSTSTTPSHTQSTSNTYYSGEFFVETFSLANGRERERGSFVSHSLGNKLPISWFNALQQNNAGAPTNTLRRQRDDDNIEDAAASLLEDDFSYGDHTAESPAAQAAVNNQWLHDGKNEGDLHDTNTNARKSSGSGNAKECPDNKWHGDAKSTASVASTGSTQSMSLWMVNELCEQDDTIEFRIFFRAAFASNSSIKVQNGAGGGETSAQHVVFKKSFKFQLLKDCQLLLRKSAVGTLDYTSLPLYSTDCTVHFPSYTLSSQTAATSFAPTPGILVELQRLNVPCNSGGYLRFNERTKLCGKLEELSVNERTFHFDVLANTSVRIVKNPMFSLRYKLVDYCYNMSTSNQTGEYYVRPTMHESLECFFRIHMPHGNRILLRLATNNASDILQASRNGMGSDGNEVDTDLAIYTSKGISFETQIINLTLGDHNYMTQSRTGTISAADANSESLKTNEAYDSFAFLTDVNVMLDAVSAFTTANCAGVVIKVFENDFAKWSHCVPNAHEQRGFVMESTSNTLSIHLYRPPTSGRAQYGADTQSALPEHTFLLPAIYLSYEARPVPAIVSNCAFGWIAMQQFCVAAIETEHTWFDAEQKCVELGGHLASIRNDMHQQIIDEMLVNSPGYQDHYAYWVGGSDKNFEGDFRWSDGLPFQYTNWFSGWSQHGHYNKQPNDDGLSSQDCIELRRYFRTPPGTQTNRNSLTSHFMWNDRDCNAKNFMICERAMSDETLRRSWINDCNKTVSLTKEHSRASVWSPSFPRQYPDNANCFTTITAPSGYRIVIEFEELVIESEPGCTYDYLEITEPTHADSTKIPKSSKHKNTNGNTNSANSKNNTNKSIKKNFRKRSSYENPSLSSYTTNSNSNSNSNSNANSTTNYNANANNNNNNVYSNSFNNLNIAQTNYHNLLNIFSNLYKPHTNFLIQTPDYPKGNPYYPTNHMRSEEVLPKRLCGDWSSKLKLLRHVTTGSYLGLHFVSDYSHHFGGYKAKAYMENTASECANERLKPYNGSCYLFVSYPEVDWWTAQQVCRSMGAKLSSVSTADEHRFITSNIRNQIDYSPQLIYWLGAELERNGQFEWTDDSKMSFEGWLPGQGQFDVVPADATCLGLQWKMSPTPMLPSGLYWQSQKCNKIGGYVCKKPKESFGKFAFNNLTVTGTEGRLVSPAYPNSYPLNIDYWIHIQAPERTRIVVQFQKIDLEPQDECLYDFVSIQNYELISKITLEPGVNPIPMAMLTSNELAEDDTIRLYRRDLLLHNKLHHRTGRSIKAYKKQTSNEKIKQRNLINVANTLDLMKTSSTMQMLPKNHEHKMSRQDQIRSADNRKYHNSMQRRASTIKSNENPKRRRRKNRTKQIAINFKRATVQHNSRLIQRRSHQRRTRRSTVVGGGSFGDDAMSAPSADNAQSFLPYVRWCGSHDSNMSKFDFVSSSNQVVLNFHSDYSITGLGFAAVWKAIDVSGCPVQTLTSREGTVNSPNYPHFLLNSLNCAYVIQAPVGRRVWLEFLEFDLLSDAALEVDIGNGVFRPFRQRQHVNDGIFISLREQLRVQFRTGQHPRGKGFQAIYHTVGQLERRERVINLTSNVTGYLFQLNFPHDMPDNVDFTQNLVAPFGDNILLELHGVEFSDNGCPDNSILEIYDNYADNNGTKWQLCKFQDAPFHTASVYDVDGAYGSTEQYPYGYHQTRYDSPHSATVRSSRLSASSMTSAAPQQQLFSAPPVYITSYLNTLHIRQRTTSKSDANLNATVRIQLDNNYKIKLASGDKSVESCQPNPCQFNGKCVTNNGSNSCQCQGHYTGRFCGLNLCELEPCVFGKCELTATNFKCQCQLGYMGVTCEQKRRPCADNPCEGRGMCYEKNGGFFCRCHAWWEGHRCERRMLHIPYKPLSERMLQEPFWLGLITVFVVLAVIGLVWCAKRHFPEKIEKLLAEEADRNRPPGSIHGHHHHTSLREQLQFTTAIPQTTTTNAPGAPRSIFNRLGIRKPSLLSLSSPNPIPGGGGAAARTFSLDDLLRPPPRRSPSPRKKRNNSTPVKKNAAEKKQILQQLVSPAAAAPKPKVSLDELISMSENRLRINVADSESDLKETTFSENSGSQASNSVTRTIIDSKLEKKVTFARLLNKVSAEMSSGSEVDIGQMGGTRNSSALSLPTDIQFRASSMPPSPCTNDIRSPHSTSSNQGSDSLSSSDLALADFGMRSLQAHVVDNGINHNNAGMPVSLQRCRIGSAARPKVSSADSILAMFRNFASTTTPASNTNTATIQSNASVFISPSATPTACSPQDDAPGDDESSTSSMHTPVSYSSGPPDSPVFYRQTTIEVPVLDVLNAHKHSSPSSSTSSSSTNLLHPPTILLEIPSSGINNKCLSPIREMPTPMPSPALTPIMPRPQRSNSPIFQEDPLSIGDYSDDDERSDRSDAQLSDHILLGLKLDKYRSIETDVDATPTETTNTSTAAIGKLPVLRLMSAPTPPKSTLTPPCITIDVEPPTPEEKTPRPRDLIIPTLTVEQPSPTKNRYPMIIFPGSPPPQRASIGETSFMFPNKQQQKRLLKQFEKPTSLDFPFAPPMITITSNMSELESDAEPLSPAPKVSAGGGLMPPNPVGMCYLSPFTMCSRADRTISESNLSSSGYSSMASPGPSRCGSSNPLCPNEMDEPGSGHSGAGISLHVNLLNRRRNSALASCKENITNGKSVSPSTSNADQIERHRQRSDSETFSDDILLESNDEGIGTDHIDEKLDDCRLSDNLFKELNLFMEGQVLIEVDEPPPPPATTSAPANNQMAQLQLPQIVIQIDGNEKGLSPVSSRSESPLSERAGIARFSPHFYGRKDQLPFTDSDGLYDFPSSDGKGVSTHSYTHQRRSSSKKRERKSSKCSVTQSPTKNQLDVPSKSDTLNSPTSSVSTHVCNKHCHSHHHPCAANTVTTRKSPKRRPVSRHPVASSSSSSESLISAKELAVRPLPRRLNSPNREKRPRKQESLSEDEVADALLRRISPSIVKEETDSAKPKCKINRLRAIGNQIRFLRRLEKSIKTRERLASPSDSCPEENTDDMDSPQATSPLLQPPSPSKTRLALCRQKRIPAGTYGLTAAAMNTDSWKGTDRSLIADDLNSD